MCTGSEQANAVASCARAIVLALLATGVYIQNSFGQEPHPVVVGTPASTVQASVDAQKLRNSDQSRTSFDNWIAAVQDPNAKAQAPQAQQTAAAAHPRVAAIAQGSLPSTPRRNMGANQLDWWAPLANQSVMARPRWVRFDLETVLIDTLEHSPRISSVSKRTSVALERVIQQDAAFDPTILLGMTGGRTNDPVGNSLTTGGDARLQEETMGLRAGLQQTTRTGSTIQMSQRLGLLDSNSTFLTPENQGSSNLALNLTKPLLERGGRLYNERLLTQARIDSEIAWQDMRSDVERRIANVMSSYWRLYEARCHVIQQRDLVERGEKIEELILARTGYDSSRIELAKVRQRIARRYDRLIAQEAEVRRQQSRISTLIGSEAFLGVESDLELIPNGGQINPNLDWSLRDAVVQGMQYRPEIRSATEDLEAASLAVHVTRTELVPQLNAIFGTTLGSVNGNFRMGQSLVDQFRTGPGVSAGLQYEMPRGRRAAKSRHREANHAYQQKSEELREALTQARWEIESALIEVQRTSDQTRSKRTLLSAALEEEKVLTRRWELMGSEGGRMGVVLENLLDAQQRRTDAEQERVTTQSENMNSIINLQRAMGTLLINEGITPLKSDCGSAVEFVRERTQPIYRLDGQPNSFMPIPPPVFAPTPSAQTPVKPMTTTSPNVNVPGELIR